MGHSIRASATKLLLVNPLLYLVLYLAAIPSFAAFYAFVLPHDFYAPFAHLEPAAIADQLRLSQILEASMGLPEKHRKISISNLRVTDDEKITFAVTVADESGKPMTLDGGAPVTISGSGTEIMRRACDADQHGCREMRYVHWKPTITMPQFTLKVVSPEEFVSTFREWEAHPEPLGALMDLLDLQTQGITLGQDDATFMENVRRANRGDASTVSGHFLRMLYMSVVVLTTLGLGDIVPMTPISRTAVATEAMLGIAFAGLFLNALANKVAQSVDRHRQ